MNNKDDVKRANILMKALKILFYSELKNLKFNTKKKGVITNINDDGTVNLTINGEAKDNVKVRPGLTINVGGVVWVELPNNELRYAFVDISL